MTNQLIIICYYRKFALSYFVKMTNKENNFDVHITQNRNDFKNRFSTQQTFIDVNFLANIVSYLKCEVVQA